MFFQLIRGTVRHSDPVYVELDQWIKEIAAGTEGWLGSTAGVTGDNRFVGLARWESEEAARRHAARPEQIHWWSAFSELFPQPPTFQETSNIVVDTPGDPDHARFVQVIQGHGSDAARALQLMGSHSAEWADFRPEILGSIGATFDDSSFVMAVYFTDEQAAREGERRQPPPELQADMDQLNSLMEGKPEFLDLYEPWVHSPT